MNNDYGEISFWDRVSEDDMLWLMKVINSIEPGNDLEITYHFGDQREDFDGIGYDDDSWSIRERRGFKLNNNGKLFESGCVSLVCENFLNDKLNNQPECYEYSR